MTGNFSKKVAHRPLKSILSREFLENNCYGLSGDSRKEPCIYYGKKDCPATCHYAIAMARPQTSVAIQRFDSRRVHALEKGFEWNYSS